jgi:hypothetical protein
MNESIGFLAQPARLRSRNLRSDGAVKAQCALSVCSLPLSSYQQFRPGQFRPSHFRPGLARFLQFDQPTSTRARPSALLR